MQISETRGADAGDRLDLECKAQLLRPYIKGPSLWRSAKATFQRYIKIIHVVRTTMASLWLLLCFKAGFPRHLSDEGWFNPVTPKGSLAAYCRILARYVFKTPYTPVSSYKLGGGFMLVSEEDMKGMFLLMARDILKRRGPSVLKTYQSRRCARHLRPQA